MATNLYQIEPGAAHPLGAVPDEQGVNLSLFSEHATSVELLLFAEHNDPEPLQVIPLDPVINRTFHFWHVHVRGLQPGMHYAYRLDGPQDTHETGNRFNKNKVVIDPYTRGITTALWSRAGATGPDDNLHTSMRSSIIDTSKYDWEADHPLQRSITETSIYKIIVVGFNHNSEGNYVGPTNNFKGLDNSTYYLLVPGDKQYYLDFTGTGNTFNCNHPIVDKLIAECLEFWVKEMHVDGFRFDEASILSRDEEGKPMAYPPVVWHISLDETLADTKIIAEAWDAAGLYQVGNFPGERWAEWNGRYRDDIRRFVKGDPGLVGTVASRIAGSSDLYQSKGRLPINSINFINCHDGFTLNDLVSYNAKHNEANGEA